MESLLTIICIIFFPFLITAYPFIWNRPIKRYLAIVAIFALTIPTLLHNPIILLHASALLLLLTQLSESGRLYWARLFSPASLAYPNIVTHQEKFYLVWVSILTIIVSSIFAHYHSEILFADNITIVISSIFLGWGIKDHRKYFIPAAALYLTTAGSTIYNIGQNIHNSVHMDNLFYVICIIYFSILAGLLYWLFKKPGNRPLIFLGLFQFLTVSLYFFHMYIMVTRNLYPEFVEMDIVIAIAITIFFLNFLMPQLFALIGMHQYRKMSERQR